MIKHSENALRDALSRLVAGAWMKGDERPCFSIPANEKRDADLILEAAIDELMELRGGVRDKTLRELQTTLPWTIHYHRDFRATPMAHKDFGHALLHVLKASGKLAAIVNDAEHAGHDFAHAEVAPYVADLVVCALRMANTCPNGVIDLQHAVDERIATKSQRPADAVPTGAPARGDR